MNFIYEEILDENIPKDLHQAYRRSQKYNSTQHTHTDHDAVSSGNRRVVRYRYGDSTYKEISKEEALRLIQEDPHNVEYIRGIMAGDLVEYEYQDNKFYALYANPNVSVSYEKPNGQIVTKKNIRYITNPKVWIPLLDKIYWTDEYEHPISDEEDAERKKSYDVLGISDFSPVSDPNFNQFLPFDHIKSKVKMTRHRVPDIGRHANSAAKADIIYSPTSSRATLTGDIEDIAYIDFDPDLQDTLRHYRACLSSKENAFKTYSHVRKALKKLIRDKDDYDDEEYSELLELWKKKEKDTLREYNELSLQASRLKTKLDKYIHTIGDSFSLKFAKVVFNLQKALKNCVQLKTQIDKLKSKSLDILDASDMNAAYGGAERELLSRIANTNYKINELIDELKELEDHTKTIDVDSDAHAESLSEIESKLTEINDADTSLDALRKQLLSIYMRRYNELNKEMLEIETKVNELKPTRAAKKAAKAKAAGKAVLDPALSNIIQFEDEQEQEDVQSA